jgi:hypothetical protein
MMLKIQSSNPSLTKKNNHFLVVALRLLPLPGFI